MLRNQYHIELVDLMTIKRNQIGEEVSLSTIHDELKERGLDKPIASKYGDVYGELMAAANYCGYKSVPAPIWGTWQHGAHIPEDNIHPELVVGADGASRFRKNHRQIVARDDQKLFLESHGYKSVQAIGLPILYVPRPDVSRVPDSLLVMPVHSTLDKTDLKSIQKYVDYLESKKTYFKEIVVCLYGDDFKSAGFRELFEDRGFPVIRGSEAGDVSSLSRMAFLFSRFETVTGNGAGSQFVYAPIFGAKVAISGPQIKARPIESLNLPFYQNFPEGLAIRRDDPLENSWKRHYSFLFCEPNKAANSSAWALAISGEEARLSAGDLERALGWAPFMVRFTRLLIYKSWELKNFLKKVKLPK